MILCIMLLYFQVVNHWCSYETFLQALQVYMVHDSVELASEVVVLRLLLQVFYVIHLELLFSLFLMIKINDV